MDFLRAILPGPVKGFLAAAAGLVLWGSDLAGIQHGTVAKSIATVVLAALTGDAVAKNHQGANDAKKAAGLLNGVSSGQ